MRSFRINEAALNTIAEEARRNSMTTNALLDKICTCYASYDRFLPKANILKISQQVLNVLLEAAPLDAIETAARSNAAVQSAMIVAKSGELNLDSLLEHFRSSSQAQGVGYSEINSKKKIVIVFFFRGGPNSRLYSKLSAQYLFEMANISSTCSTTEDCITCEIPIHNGNVQDARVQFGFPIPRDRSLH